MRSATLAVRPAIGDARQGDRALDELAAGQQDDGGWDFDWLAWDPAVANETRGRVTVEAVKLLRINGR